MDKCGECRFWKNYQFIAPMCRRYPLNIGKGPDDWCGEFKISIAAERVRADAEVAEFRKTNPLPGKRK